MGIELKWEPEEMQGEPQIPEMHKSLLGGHWTPDFHDIPIMTGFPNWDVMKVWSETK